MLRPTMAVYRPIGHRRHRHGRLRVGATRRLAPPHGRRCAHRCRHRAGRPGGHCTRLRAQWVAAVPPLRARVRRGLAGADPVDVADGDAGRCSRPGRPVAAARAGTGWPPGSVVSRPSGRPTRSPCSSWSRLVSSSWPPERGRATAVGAGPGHGAERRERRLLVALHAAVLPVRLGAPLHARDDPGGVGAVAAVHRSATSWRGTVAMAVGRGCRGRRARHRGDRASARWRASTQGSSPRSAPGPSVCTCRTRWAHTPVPGQRDPAPERAHDPRAHGVGPVLGQLPPVLADVPFHPQPARPGIGDGFRP